MIRSYLENFIFDIRWKVQDLKYHIVNFIFKVKTSYKIYKLFSKGYLDTNEYKGIFYFFYMFMPDLIDFILDVYDIEWLEKRYKIENLEERLKKFKKNIVLYYKWYIVKDKEYDIDYDYIKQFSEMFSDLWRTVEDSMEIEKLRQRYLLEDEILRDFAELKRVLNI